MIALGFDILAAAATLAGALFVALAVWSLRARGTYNRRRMTLAFALTATGIWAGFVGIFPSESGVAALLETMRNGSWAVHMWVLSAALGREYFLRPVRLIYKVIFILMAGLLLLQAADVASIIDSGQLVLVRSLYANLGLVIAAGLLVLAHNLYTIIAPEGRRSVGPTLAALTAIWAYDLNLYAIGIFDRSPAQGLIALRPALALLLVPLFVLDQFREERAQLKVSRTVAFQSLSLFAIGAYLGLMSLLASFVRSFGGDYGELAQRLVLVAALVLLVMLVMSSKLRGWLRIVVSKNFFRHRYDYRHEWMRFNETLAQEEGEAEALQLRAIKAIADITGSPGGALIMMGEGKTLSAQYLWRWDDFAGADEELPVSTMIHLQQHRRVVEFEALRKMPVGQGERAEFPAWMLADPSIWVAVPLVHFDRLAGLILLYRPAHARRLDWEDFDLLKTAGRQVASYLSEAQGQFELSEARRFEEFNRRFAFIMHDIKNAVSQLSILARNAERHADNPEFRKDMVDTLNNSVGRMNTMLARLSQHNQSKTIELESVSLRDVVDEVHRAKRDQHKVIIGQEQDLYAYADRERVTQILSHLVQNAIDASAQDEPIQITIRQHKSHMAIDVVDCGQGMTAEYIRDELFTPFSSTKNDGFGVGAFEARTLAQAMNGRIEVKSNPGDGSRFTLWLPSADKAQMPTTTAKNDRNAA